jgi:hypothetical protein
MRDPVTLTPEILSMLDRHEPDKSKQAKLLTDHLACHMTLPSSEEELMQHLERKAKRDADRLLGATEAKTAKQEKAKQAEATKHQHNAMVIAAFAKRAKDAAIVEGATTEEAEVAGQAATAKAETTFADNIAMQECY